MKKKSTVKYTSKNLPPDSKSNWEKIRSLTDADIDQAIAEDPDAAPSPNQGEGTGIGTLQLPCFS